MIISLSFHEFCHAFVAKLLGDDTAERAGRLTINPVAHIDPIGTLLIPAIGAFSGVPLIGWAKPVPVDPRRFRSTVDKRRGYLLVSAAGPFSNLFLAFLAAAILAFGGHGVRDNRGIVELLIILLQMNVGLCVLNLLPIPPLDGSKLLPRALDPMMASIQRYGMMILMLVMFIPPLSRAVFGTPVRFIVGLILRAFSL